MLVSWLYNSLDPSVKITMSRITDAKEMWDSLKTRYSVPNDPRGFKLWTDLSTTRQNGTSVLVYYTKLLGMWEELLTLSPTIDVPWFDALKAYQFLMGFISHYPNSNY